MAVKYLFLIISTLFFSQNVHGDWRWTDKVAVVTGASSGIGAEIALQLANKGMKVAAIARRTHKLEDIAQKTTGKIFPVTCDLTDENDIKQAFRWVEDNLGGVDVLVNNAGTLLLASLLNGETKDWNIMFDVNVLGTAICTREALKTMRTRGDNGQIININSIAGLQVFHIKNVPNGIYTASKFALTALSEALSNELSDAGSRIKVTNLSPGLVITELVTNSSIGNPEFRNVFENADHLEVEDIAEGVIYVLSTNPNVHIPQLSINHHMEPKSC